MKRLFTLVVSLAMVAQIFAAAEKKAGNGYVSVLGTHFYLNGKPSYHVGANMWYAAILASKGKDGDRKRLRRELDELHAMGADYLRVWINFGHVETDTLSSTLPTLWLENGEANDTLLAGLDILMKELGKREMKAVVCLSATDTWSGGPAFYIQEAHKSVNAQEAADSAGTQQIDASAFYEDEAAVEKYLEHVRFLVGRTNRYTRRAYKDDETLMAWEICDRMHPAADSNGGAAFVRFIAQAARAIKQADANHLVAVGGDGIRGCNGNELIYQQIHNDPMIDYATLQLWPLEWDWVARGRVAEDLPNVFIQATEYLAQHLRMAERMDKPLVIDAFSYPRDRFFFSPSQATNCRNDFYTFVLTQLTKNAREKGALAGCYFWAWAGNGLSQNLKWKAGCFVGDTPDRPQGLFAVFSTDLSTKQEIQKATEELRGLSGE